MLWLGIVSYGAAALLYGVIALIVVASHPGGSRATWLTAAIVVSSVWAGSLAVSLSASLSVATVIGLDAVHLLFWTICVLSTLGSQPVRKWLVTASAATGLFAVAGAWSEGPFAVQDQVPYIALVLMSFFGVLAVEQIYRNAQEDARRELKPLCLAIGVIFAVDLFVYSHAALLGAPQPLFWLARGFANAAVVPLIVLGVKKGGEWQRLFVSRHVVFYTTSALVIGGYLLTMGFVAYVIGALGREWSFPLDVLFLTAGIGVLVFVLFSRSIRARFKVFLLKHFYRSDYDYREEWLRLTQILSRTGDLQHSAANGLQGMAQIIGSERGGLWVEKDGQRYEWLASLGDAFPVKVHFEREDPLIVFLSSTGWVVDSEEYAESPDRYGTAFGRPDEGRLPRNSLIVPLDRQGYLQGFVILGKPAALRSLDFDDHDILKTAGRQVAAVLAQALAQEKLSETRQFEALNRLSMFLMHDLKNIVAQQDLVLANAQRFRHRPDFIDDAFKTVRAGTERIKKVLGQLATASRTSPPPGRVDVSKVLMEVRSRSADRQPIPEIGTLAQAAWVRVDHDELTNVLLHLVRNAQDATARDGRIDLGLTKGSGEHVIAVSDTGSGMDEAFVRDRLFRPFDSTKGAEGMGIGAYQARHIVRQAGGELDVTSALGRGTTFRVRLPAAD
jgi:putative PEP-CTERM system histidine kinase